MKHFFVIFGFFVLAAASFLIYSQNEDQKEVKRAPQEDIVTDNIERQNAANKHHPIEEKDEERTQPLNVDNNKNEAGEEGITHTQYDIIGEFEASRGLFPSDVKEQYRQYTSEVLRTLSDQGDMLATQTLAGRAEKEGDIPLAIDHHVKAAAQGSTKSINSLSSLWFNEYKMAQHNEQEAEMQRAKIEMYSWLEVLRKRNHPGVQDNIDFYKNNQNISLSDEEKHIVNQNADRYYRSLEQDRRELGYGEFDNRIPKEVQELLGEP